MDEKVYLHIRTSRTGEETPEAMAQLLSSLTGLVRRVFMTYKKGIPFSLEIAYFDSMIHFYVVVPKTMQALIESQILAQYPKALIVKTPDYIAELPETAYTEFTRLKLKGNYLLPIKTYKDSTEVDLLSSVLGTLSKLNKEDNVVIQYLLIPVTYNWQASGQNAMQIKVKNADGTVSTTSNPQAPEITQKISNNGFRVGIRVLVKSNNPGAYHQVVNSFAVFNKASGNSIGMHRTYPWQKNGLLKAIQERNPKYVPRYQIMNVTEIASLYHFPNLTLSTIPNISWSKTILSDPPENLPVAYNMNDDEKKDVNFFARTEYKNQLTVLGIKRKDRRRHMYIIGKTGTGKSTLIANMVINDMRNGEGVAVIDPHGDLTEVILDYVPSHRINDVVYLNPGDRNSLFHLNPLEAGGSHKDLVSSGIVAIFQKLYAHSWGPRLEYILRNTIVSLLEVPDATLMMVPQMLTDARFRARVVERLQDPVMKNFWVNEFDKMQPRQVTEATAPILNKVGQFLSSDVIRTIVGHPKSTVDLRYIMDNKKILLFNLSQGKLGEDNSALLGAMTITKLQLAAMARVDTPEEERKDFYLYVDEFQNFATTSFIKILSEARKYRLCLNLANQYTAQIPEELMAAIFGNVGTMLTFIVGAQDSTLLAKEYGERFKEEDLLSLGNYQALTKLYIDGTTSSPFLAYTLPLPRSINKNREKVIRVSNERFGSKQKPVEPLPDTVNEPDISRKEERKTEPKPTTQPEKSPDQVNKEHNRQSDEKVQSPPTEHVKKNQDHTPSKNTQQSSDSDGQSTHQPKQNKKKKKKKKGGQQHHSQQQSQDHGGHHKDQQKNPTQDKNNESSLSQSGTFILNQKDQ